MSEMSNAAVVGDDARRLRSSTTLHRSPPFSPEKKVDRVVYHGDPLALFSSRPKQSYIQALSCSNGREKIWSPAASHVLPCGCAESAVESGVNLANRGLMRYLPEDIEAMPTPPPTQHKPARPCTCDISNGQPTTGRHENGTISAEISSWRPNWDVGHVARPQRWRQLP